MDRMTNPAPRTGPPRLAFHPSRIIIDTGVLIAMAAMSLPFVTGAGADRNSVAADALPAILLLAPVFLVTLLPDHARPVPAPLAWGALVPVVAAFPYSIVKYLDAANLASTIGGGVGFGARLLIFGTFVTLCGVGVTLAGAMVRPAPAPRSRPSRPTRPAPARSAPPGAGSQPGDRSRRTAQPGGVPQPRRTPDQRTATDPRRLPQPGQIRREPPHADPGARPQRRPRPEQPPGSGAT